MADEGDCGPGIKGDVDRVGLVVEGEDLAGEGGKAVDGWGRVVILMRARL